MPSMDEAIENKLDEQLQKIKSELIIFNTIQDLTEKIHTKVRGGDREVEE